MQNSINTWKTKAPIIDLQFMTLYSSVKTTTRQVTPKLTVGLKEVDRRVNTPIGSKEGKVRTTTQ